VILQADMRALARGEWVEAAAASMLRSNGPAARAMAAAVYESSPPLSNTTASGISGSCRL